MPLKLNIAISRKVGQPNFGSRGASVGFELEVDAGLIEKPRQLHDQVAQLFRLARASVEHELGVGESSGIPPDLLATPAQIRTLRAMARERHLDVAAELNHRFGVNMLSDLTKEQASQLIASAWHASDVPRRNGSAAEPLQA